MRIRRFTERLKSYFTFTKRERNGILVLFILMLTMQGFVIYTGFLEPTIPSSQSIVFKNEILAFENAIAVNNTIETIDAKHEKLKDSIIPAANIHYKYFDPNKTSNQLWKEFGIKENTIRAITNYLAKGGRFKKKEDLKKIYTLNAKEYERLSPYIVIEDSSNAKERSKRLNQEYASKPILMIELNKATQSDLMMLPMIGEKRAQQIIKYRELLGGFVEKEQLKEIYGFPDSVYQLILPNILVNSDAITHININADSISSLKHLYIKKPFARLIVNYRLQHGNYHSVEEIRKLPLSDDSLFRKISKYLVTE